MRVFIPLILAVIVFAGCGGIDQITMQEEAQNQLATNCWKYQVELFWQNTNIPFETAKLWTMLTGLANGLSEDEIDKVLTEMEAKYGELKNQSRPVSDAGRIA